MIRESSNPNGQFFKLSKQIGWQLVLCLSVTIKFTKMNAFDGLIDDLNKADFDFIENHLKDIDDLNKVKFDKKCPKLWLVPYSQVVSRYVARVNESIQEYQRTGESDISNLLISDDCESGNQSQGTSKCIFKTFFAGVTKN
jgi:hypothetical protein